MTMRIGSLTVYRMSWEVSAQELMFKALPCGFRSIFLIRWFWWLVSVIHAGINECCDGCILCELGWGKALSLIVLADNPAVVRPLNDDWSYADCIRMAPYEFSCRRLSLNYQGMKPSRFWWWFMYLSPSPWSSSPTSPQYGRHVRTSRASCREPSDEEMIRSKVEQSGDQCNSRAEKSQ